MTENSILVKEQATLPEKVAEKPILVEEEKISKEKMTENSILVKEQATLPEKVAEKPILVEEEKISKEKVTEMSVTVAPETPVLAAIAAIDPATTDTDVADAEAIRHPEAGSYAANLAASNNLFITRLADRTGETAYIDPVTGQHDVTSLWMRHQGGQNRVHDHTGQLSTKAHHYVVQIGGNVVQDLQGWDIGVMAGYARSHSKTRSQQLGYQSSGTVNGYNLGVYATWYANKAEHVGPYVDTALQYSWFNNTVAGEGIARETYQSRGITASIEGGYTVKLAEIANAGYFIEPKAKTVWMGVKTGDRVESNGTHVSTRGEGNLQTQLGVKAFMQINPGKTHSFRPFIETNWVHNTRDVAVTMDGVTSRQAGNRNSAQFILGAEGQLNHQFSLHGNLAHQVGSKGYQDSSVVLGGKYRF